MDSFDDILSAWGSEVNKFETYAVLLAEREMKFKSYEASAKKAIMDTGESAAKAEAMVRATPEWSEHYLAVQKGNATVETVKQRIKLHAAEFEAERSRNANARRVE